MSQPIGVEKIREEGKDIRRIESIAQHAIVLLVVMVGVFAASFSNGVYANPQGGQVSAGNATIQSSAPNQVDIHQSTDKAVIDWHSFNIGQHEKTQFHQPSSSSITLNRIDPAQGVSQILGALQANGRVWLINPAGIFFGAGARVDVAGLVASTANITNQDFMAGNYRFVQSPNWNGAVINEGRITIADKGLAMLVAPGVENRGLITANLGTIVLAAGNEYTLDFYGDGLIQFKVDAKSLAPGKDKDGKVLENAVSNTGTLIANGGTVLMTAQTAAKVVRNTINMKGYVVAKAAVQKGGSIILMGGDQGAVHVEGTMVASGKEVNQKGGKVKITGEKIVVAENSKIDVSGHGGGGEILVGGDYQGKNPDVQNAISTFVASNTEMNADAIAVGDGGKVILWADNLTQFYGTIFARGGIEGGNGGLVETSGKEVLLTSGGRVYASAPLGKAGMWLLDPRNVVINTSTTTCTTAPCFSGGDPDVYTPDTNISNVDVNDILAALNAGTSVTITTGTTGNRAGTIDVNTAISKTTGATPVTLTLDSSNAGGTITVSNPISASGSSGALGITLLSGNAISIDSDITTNGGNFLATSQNATSIGSSIAVNTGAGTFTVNANQDGAGGQGFDMGTNSSITTTNATDSAVSINVNTLAGSGTGNAALRSITASSGTVSVNTETGGSTGGDITQTAGTVTANAIQFTTSQSGARNIGTSGSNITINAAALNATTGTAGIFITNNGTSALDLGTINTAGDFSLTSTGSSAITDSGTITVTGDTTLAAGASQNITLNTSTNDFGVVGITSANDVTLVDANAIDLAASTVTGALNITAGGAVTDSGNVVVAGATTISAAGQDVTFDRTGNDFSSIGVTANNVSLRDANALILGSSTIGGTLSVLTAGALTQNNPLSVTGTSGFSVGANSIALTDSGNSFTGAVSLTNSGANDVSVITGSTPLVIAASTIGGNLALTSAGGISQTGAITATGGTTTVAVSAAAQDILLDTQANNFGTSALVFGGTLSNIRNVGIQNSNSSAVLPSFAGLTNLHDLTLNFTASNMTLPAITLTNGGSLSVTARGASGFAIAQSGSLVVPGTASFTATTGASGTRAVTLTDSGNQFTGAVTLDNGGASADASITNSLALVLGNISVGNGALTLTGAGISQTGAITQTGPNTGAVTLTGNAGVINLINASNSLLGTVSATNSAANSVSVLTSGSLSLGNFTLVGASDLALTGVGLTQAAGTNINSGSGAMTLDAGGSTMDFSTGSLTTTNASANAIRFLYASTIALGNISASLGTVTIGTGSVSGAVTQNNGTTITANTVIGNTTNAVTLANTGNAISSIGNFTTDGIFSVINGSAMTVSGDVSTNGNALSFTAIGLTQNASTTVNAGAGTITLNSGTGTLARNANALLLGTGTINLVGDAMAFDSTSQIGGSASGVGSASTVIFRQSTNGTTMGVSGGAGSLALSENELNTTRATNVRMGDANSGAMVINAWTPNANFATGVLTLQTPGTITQGGVINLATSGSSLLLRDASSVTLTNANSINAIAASLNGGLAVTTTTPMTVTSLTDDVGTVNGITTTDPVTLSAGGLLTVNQNISTSNDMISLTGAGITQAASTTVNAGTANLTLDAGSNTITTNADSDLYSRGTVTLTANAMSLSTTGSQVGGNGTGAGTDKAAAVILAGASGTTIGIAGGNGTLSLPVSVLDTIRATDLRIGNSTAGAMELGAWTPLSTTLVGGVLSLSSGSHITQTGALDLSTSGGSLILRSGGNVTMNSTNVASVLAASITGSLSFVNNSASNPALDIDSLSDDIGTVNGVTAAGGVTISAQGVNGLRVNNGGVSATDNAISLTGTGINVTAGDNISAGSGNITLNAGTGTLTTAGSALLLSTGTITLAGDQMSLAGQTGGTGSGTGSAEHVIIRPFTNNTSMGLAGGAGTVTITAGQLNNIQTANLQLGDSNTGDMTFAGWNAAANVATNVLTLSTAGAITQSAGTINLSSTGSNLLLRNASSVSLTNNNNISQIAASSVGDVSLTSSQALAIASMTDNIGTANGISSSGNVTLISSGAISESGSALINSALLTTRSDGGTTLNNANTVTGFNATNTGSGNISLINSGALNISGISQAVGNLSIDNTGAITDSGALTVSGISTFAAGSGNNITLDTATNNFSTVAITSGNNVSLVDGGAIDLDASTVSGAFNVSTTGAITDSGALSIAGIATFAAGSGNNITLDTATNNLGTVAITSGNNVSLVDGGAIDLGASTVSGTLGVTAGGSITQSGALSVTAGASTFTVTAANSDVSLASAANTFSSTSFATSGSGTIRDLALRNISLSASLPALPSGLRNLTLTFDNAAIDLPTATLTGDLSVTAGGAITDSGALSIAGTTTLAAGSGNNITLDTATNNFGTVAITSGNNVSLVDGGAIDLGASTVSGALNVSTSGAITDSGALSIAGTTTLAAGLGNNITLDTATNNFGTVAITSGNNVSLVDGGAIDLGTSTVSGALNVLTNGAITNSGNLTVAGTLTASAVGGITLDSAGNAIANFNPSNSGTGGITLVNTAAPLTITGFSSTGGGDVSITNAGTVAVADGVSINSTNAGLAVTATDINLNSTGALNSGTGAMTITQNSASGSIGLGNATGTMTLSGSELQRMTANSLTLNAGNNGQISVEGVSGTQSSNITDLTLSATSGSTGSIIFQNNASTFKTLTVNADNGITVGAAITSSAGNLTLDADADNTASTSDQLKLNSDLTASGSIALSAQTGGIQLGNDAALTSNGITLHDALNGGFDLTLDSGSSGDITLNANVGDLARLADFHIVNMQDLINNALLNVTSFTQDSGSLAAFGNNVGLNVTGTATIAGNNVTGALNVGALSLDTSLANVTGSVDGSTGAAAIAKITLLNTITAGTHFFDGIDMFTPAPTPLPPSDGGSTALTAAEQSIIQYLFPSINLIDEQPPALTLMSGRGEPTVAAVTELDDSKHASCTNLGANISMCAN